MPIKITVSSNSSLPIGYVTTLIFSRYFYIRDVSRRCKKMNNPKLLDQVRHAIRVRHLSYRTE